ncbi:MAG: KpsF/GutQ family sugar-phosphate isomerase [Myxococcales bacterium]|nr:KpsF/GutQ family sugar-phosphate isomerase [Myxococcales bacterium]
MGSEDRMSKTGPSLDDVAAEARASLREQAAAITTLSERIDERFTRAVEMMHSTSGHVVVAGLGKSGHVGAKIAATLASTGTPSFFVHAAEAFHGDLGMVTNRDSVILISYSGETAEVAGLLPHLRDRAVPMIALVGNPSSTLATGVDVALDVSVERETDPNDLAPTSSTLVTLAMGDALAMALVRIRGFQPDDFARLHPSGSLGRRLSRVADHMGPPPPVLDPMDTIADALLALARSSVPFVAVVSHGVLLGTVSEVDLRDAIARRDALRNRVGGFVVREVPCISVSDLIESVPAETTIVLDERGVIVGTFAAGTR